MGRDPAEQKALDPFPTAESRAAGTKIETTPQPYVLPKNLRNAVKHLSDGELDLMHAATLEELKRRGRTPYDYQSPFITPSRIAREFGISKSDVRKALASDETKR